MSQEQSPSTPRRGRPPSEVARRKALAAAHDILMQEGFGRLSIEAVAQRSGVGKPTIYRHWANAGELAMAALMAGVEEMAASPGDTLRASLRHQLRNLVRAFATTRGRQIAMALAAADPGSEFTRAFRNRVILSSREEGRRLLARAADRCEIAPPADIEVLLDMIYGPLFYRLLVGHQPLSETLADEIAELSLRALAR
jgi:Transcriptional regulator